MIKVITYAVIMMTVSVNMVLARADGRDQHYVHAAAMPETSDEARDVLRETLSEMSEYVAIKDYESIHKLSRFFRICN